MNIKKLKRHKKIIENFSYLSVLQIFSMITPLVTYPYLVKTLGEVIYGTVVFAQAVVTYFNILVVFGFNFTAARDVSQYRDDTKKLSEIVSTVTIIKTLFLIVSLLLISGYMLYISQIDYTLYYLSFWICLNEILFPSWFFQGKEEMKYITFINLGIRLLFILMIFIFIKSPDDYLYFPLLNGIGVALAGVVSFILLYKKYKVRLTVVPIKILTKYLKESYHLFISNVSIQIYVNANKIIIGTFLGMREVTYYDLAEKITNMGKVPQSMISQVLYPKISLEKNGSFLKKVLKGTILMNVFLYLMVFLFSNQIVAYFGGNETVLRILFLTIPIIGISNVLMVLTLLPFGYNKAFTRIVFLSAFSYLLIVLILYGFNSISLYTLTATNVVVESLVSIIAYIYIRRKKIINL
ncbi:oligosaccharide flippase family protein [Capnocytophaga gingivalis]|uniref:oligosaccharide flippase family protein n=1 Tax=Capnocytophaga gingivalis TaxID=1017 RepID=UPI002B48D4E2|nr:oligosaccharide flippase family protein [Capnocytophaga gingivalis]MEB3013401.1 oligosaccharide flippase family protein [Capnocytophaga gingivalis]